MRISPGEYVKAIFDFQTNEAGEIKFKTGEIILVTKVINENWVCGELDNRHGNFPINFVEHLNVPQVSNGQKLFLATDSFQSNQHGDLNFKKGDVVLGLKAVDENWWNGCIGNKTGIFPKIFIKSLPVFETQATQRNEQIDGKVNQNGISNKPKSDNSVKVPFNATALVDITPQLDEELGFRAGDVLTILEVVDEDWLSAELNGKVGLVSSVCVDLPKNFAKSTQDVLCNTTGTVNLYLNTSNSENVDAILHKESWNKANSYTDRTQTTSQSFDQHDAYKINTDGDVYAYLDAYNASIDTDDSNTAGLYSYTSENTRSADAEITPYARVLYPFVGQSSEELTINENDIVTLIQHTDSDWIEGELDGKIGLFPTNYVEIIVDCPYAFTQESVNDSNFKSENYDQNENIKCESESVKDDSFKEPLEALSEAASEPQSSFTDCAQNQDHLVEEESSQDTGIPCNDLAIVKFSIQAATEYDLSISEGDTITIITRYEDNWLQARDDNGNIGLVPSNYVEFIGDGPECEHSDIAIEQSDTTSETCAIINTEHNNNTTVDTINGNIVNTQTSETVSHNTDIKHHFDAKDHCEIPESVSLNDKQQSESKTCSSEDLSTQESEVTSDSDTASSSTKDAETLSIKSNSSEDLSKPKKPVPLPKPKIAIKPNLKLKPAIATKPSLKSKPSKLQSKPSVSTPTEKVFKKIDPADSLDSIISSQLFKAKSESKDVKGSEDSKRVVVNSHRNSVRFSTSESPPPNRPPPIPPSSQSVFNSKTETSVNSKFQKSISLCHEDFVLSRQPEKSDPARPRPPRPKSVSFGRSSFYLNDGYLKNDEADLSMERKDSFKNKSTAKTPPPRPSKANDRSRVLPSRPAPIAPGKRIVPARRAPPRPSASAPRKPSATPVPRKRLSMSQPNLTAPDLMSFSPEEQAVDEENAEVIADLKLRITEIETDLQKYVKSKEDVIHMLKTVKGEKEEEIKDNLGFYEANISGLSDELKKLKENLYQLSPKEKRAAEIQEEIERRKEEEKRKMEEERKQRANEKEKRRDKRDNVIDEIIDTEKSFLHYLQLTMETFLGPNSEKIAGVDYERLFGNMEEIADVSQRFLTSLENGVVGKPFEEQIVGTSFVKFAEDMKNTYAPYCRNHDEVITIMEKYKANAEIREYFQKMINDMREYCNVFDLDALLIKPIQRILKYPLLIAELIRVTEDDHKDKVEICKAINSITDVAKAINEYKRRKDLVYKYKKISDASFGDMISKLSLHTLKKKSNRMRGRLSTTMGISLQTKDENFEREEYKFRHLEKSVKVLVKNVQAYLDNLQDSITCQESYVISTEDFYGDKAPNEVQKYKVLYQKISIQHFPQMKSTIENLVIIPLNKLIGLFNGPIKVIEKRFDKLLDYDNLFKKSKDTEKYNEALASAKNDYEAMNAQLLDELPKLYKLAFTIFQDCLRCFVQAQKKYIDQTLQQTYSELDLPFVLGSGESFIETFNVKHTTALDRISGLSFIPRGFNPKYDSLHRQDSIKVDKKHNKRVSDTGLSKTTGSDSVQSESQKVYVIQQFSRDKLYQVSKTYTATDLMDLSINQGTVVGVLKEQDPMGNKEKWFVDDGAKKGFIHKSVLTPFYSKSPVNTSLLDSDYIDMTAISTTSTTVTGSSTFYTGTATTLQDSDYIDMTSTSTTIDTCVYTAKSTSTHINDEELADEMDSILDDLDNEDSQDYVKPEIHEYYFSEYSFAARANNEVSLFEGQVVTVLAKHDQDGNQEWWYVDADGNHGYAPSNYLKQMG